MPLEPLQRTKYHRGEQDLHKVIGAYLDVALPRGAWWLHVPMGGRRSRVEAAIMVAMGARPGIPDLLIMWQGFAYWIELKPPNKKDARHGGLSDAQQEAHQALMDCGCQVGTCYSGEQVESMLRWWGIPLRARFA